MDAETWAGKLSRLLHWAGIFVVIPILMVLIGVDVFLRYVLNSPLMWGNEVSSLLLLLIFFASIPYCTEKQEHIRMELIYTRLPRKIRGAVDLLINLSGLVFSSMLTMQAFRSTLEMYAFEDGAEMINIPYWPFALFMAFCGLFLSLQFIAFALKIFQSSKVS